MSIPLENRYKELIVELNLGNESVVSSIEPLTGGISSEIALLSVGDKKICVKFALEKLNVAQDWRAQTKRNHAEYQWLLFASTVVNGVSPALYGCSDVLFGFAMDFIEGPDVYQWKDALLKGKRNSGEAGKVGEVLGKIHQASAVSKEVNEKFQNQEDFYSLRLDPYLNYTKTQHPKLADELSQLISMLNSNCRVLLHGDVSPKNILFKQGKPILLDAECATMGDPSFDVAFCLNHLVLKAIHLRLRRKALLKSINEFWAAYQTHVKWEIVANLEKRICKLLPALMLARVDGKSPVEYLNENEQKFVRVNAASLLKDQTSTLDALIERLKGNLENLK